MERPLEKKKKREREGEEEERGGEEEEEGDEEKKKEEEGDEQKEEEEEEVIFTLNIFFQVWNHPTAAWENRRVIFNILGTNGRIVPDSTADMKMCKFPDCPHAIDVQDMMGGLERCSSQGNAPCLIVDLALA